jgi:glutathione synthase/RimK-type ligase-like ATP-grasp enzyme
MNPNALPESTAFFFNAFPIAIRTLGLRVAAVDLFTDVGGDPDAIRIIEVNSSPSIRLLEQSSRGDLILKIWHHTFATIGLLASSI